MNNNSSEYGKVLKKAKEKALSGIGISTEEALILSNIPDTSIYELLAVTDEVRRSFKGTEVNLCGIVNAKSGLCKEDCSFCSQSASFSTDSTEYPMIDAHEITEAAKEAEARGAREFSIVTSGTKISKGRDVRVLTEALKKMKESSTVERCASLGMLDKETLKTLKEAGLESYHHNLETSRSYFPEVCTTHSYEEDVDTVKRAKSSGLYVCSGGIFGLGESWAHRLELFETLSELEVDCVPINFLNPRPGTPLSDARNLTPIECLKIIALARLMLPKKDMIICGGREVNLRDLQPMIFAAGANGMMVGDYLTTKGRKTEDDLNMLSDLGLSSRASSHQ